MAKNNICFEIVANNGQVLEHSFTNEGSAKAQAKKYIERYPADAFTVRSYQAGKYGGEITHNQPEK